jgi:H(+)-transporting ATP synthase subunit D
VRCRRRLDQVRRGAALLRRKRASLVDELFARARTAVTSREAIEEEARRAWQSLWTAAAAQGGAALTPLGWPTRELSVELSVSDLWGLKLVALARKPPVARSLPARGVLPAPGEAASQEAARRFETLVEQLLEAAPQEHAMRRLGAALASTTRLVNTLEQSVAPRLDADLTAIRRSLDEREREEHVRTRRLIARRRHA